MSPRRPPASPRGEGGRRPTRNSAASAARQRGRNSGDRASRTPPGSAASAGPRSYKPAAKPAGKRAAKPASNPANPGASLPTASARRSAAREERTKFNVRFSTGERTRQFSLRLLTVLLFAAVAIVIVASPLNQYLEQQQQKRELLQQLEETTARVDLLEQELARWKDDDFVRSQARERLGYVLPGETLYLVSDPEEGTPEEIEAERTKEVNDRRRQATPFYMTMWDSIQIAGVSGEVVNPSNIPVIGTTPSSDTPAAPESETAPAGETGQPADETSPTPSSAEEGEG